MMYAISIGIGYYTMGTRVERARNIYATALVNSTSAEQNITLKCYYSKFSLQIRPVNLRPTTMVEFLPKLGHFSTQFKHTRT